MPKKSYLQLKNEIGKRINDFPIQWAFSNQQLQEGLKNLGVKDASEVCSVGAGGFIRKKDSKRFYNLLKQNADELRNALKDDDFMLEAIRYELDNHEFCITGDPYPALESLELDLSDERVRRIFNEATGQN